MNTPINKTGNISCVNDGLDEPGLWPWGLSLGLGPMSHLWTVDSNDRYRVYISASHAVESRSFELSFATIQSWKWILGIAIPLETSLGWDTL